ncbi:MAG TPA: DUF1961 family protein [Acidimicrobiales bacterium]|nr:DUF1961 family protein [Acidimicrobiales bacterium]
MTGVVYRNELGAVSDLEEVEVEGDAVFSCPLGRVRMESRRPPSDGQQANFVTWFPCRLPEQFVAEWQFWPVAEPGLAMVFFAAQAAGGGDLLAPGLAPRTGEYDHYRYGDIETYHLSYFRHSSEEERRLRTVNLRRSRGFHLLGSGADPLPAVADARPPYRLQLTREGHRIRFAVDGLTVLDAPDALDGLPPLAGGGRLGFRQMSPLIAEYAHLVVTTNH